MKQFFIALLMLRAINADAQQTGCFYVNGTSFGNVLWQKSYGGAFEEFIQGISLTTDGGYVLGGKTSDGNFPEFVRTYAVKTNGNGVIEWGKTSGDTISALYFNDIKPLANGGYIGVGGGVAVLDQDGGVCSLCSPGTYGSDVSVNILWETETFLIDDTTGYVVDTVLEFLPGLGSSNIECLTTAVETIDDKNVRTQLYPNPAAKTLTLFSTKAFSQIKIFNVQGKLCFEKSVNAKNINVDVSDFVNGFYIVEMFSNGLVERSKLVIDR